MKNKGISVVAAASFGWPSRPIQDAPPLLDWNEAEIGKFYRPKKKPVTMRLDYDVIAWLKADGHGYQTKANWLRRNAMLHFTKEASISRRRIASRRGKARQGKGRG